MKINFYCGSIFSTSGYSSHSRGLANGLDLLGHTVHLNTPLPNDQWVRFVNDAELEMIEKNKFDKDAPTVAITQPPFWKMILSEGVRNLYPFVVFEGDKIPKSWLACMFDNRIKAILVPSNHVKDAIVKTEKEFEKEMPFVLPPIRIVPHGFSPEIFKREPIQSEDTDFTFIANAGWAKGMNDRKGMQFLLRAFCEEFNEKENVKLLVKINPAYIPPGWDIQAELDKIGVNREKKAKVRFALEPGELSDIAKLYNQADVFVCPQMADAFNIPGIEAMACGLPTIQTGFGGQTDYVNEQNGWLLPYELVDAPVADLSDVSYDGVKWAMPDEKALKALMRWLVEYPDEVKEKGKQALIDAQGWTWDKSAEKLIKVLNEVT